MAVDAFLDFTNSGNGTPVQGEALDTTYAKCFHVKSCSFSITQKGTAAMGSGMSGGKAEFEEFEFTIDTQDGCAKLMQCCAAGTAFKVINLFVRKAGGDASSSATAQQVFLAYRFYNCIVSSYATSIEDESSDTIKLMYQAVSAVYGKQDASTGKVATTATAYGQGGYDVKKNNVPPQVMLTDSIGGGSPITN